MKNDVLRTMWDGRAEQHAARKRDQSCNPTSQLYNDSWWRHIEPLLPKFPNGEILEAGCGTGRWAEHLVPMGFSLTCSDLSPGMLTKAREDAELKGYADRITFKELDICDLYPFKDKQFDMVISTGEPVSLCSDPQKAISEYCRVVRHGGYVLCDAGNKYRHAFDMFRDTPSPEFMHTLETGEFTTLGKMQLHLFGPSEFANVFEKLGMKICTLAGITPMFSFPPQQTLNNALENPEMKKALEKLERDYAERPEVIALSSRLIVIAHKPL
ncbi:class I SAM-dependent methyltransferase [uncultured Pseudodesulfovibrio sp.]|uniref:class I SAM-dependent methyltransferase n=1 Tax=uncultured Pseudodesulfovibrio sp. TaxID=2035858 RepID=UPI0029C7AD35|nr:class I SAM-dependent methyltransferase [uncultured Pseudodesulfovibrio sp.]